jgi:hypothetical protein
MTTLLIPTVDASELGNFSLSVSLDGEDYQFDFKYNGREDAWYFDLLDVAGNQLRSGVKVVSNFPLLWRYRDATRPDGEVLAIDTRSAPEDPLLADLGTLINMAYEQAESVPS